MNDLDIHSYQLNPYEMSQVIPFNKSQYNEQYDKWTIPIPLPEGKLNTSQTVILSIDYTGYMRDDMRGFYRSYYMENGKKVWMGTTQFQPVHARRAFPCFDVSFLSIENRGRLLIRYAFRGEGDLKFCNSFHKKFLKLGGGGFENTFFLT